MSDAQLSDFYCYHSRLAKKFVAAGPERLTHPTNNRYSISKVNDALSDIADPDERDLRLARFAHLIAKNIRGLREKVLPDVFGELSEAAATNLSVVAMNISNANAFASLTAKLAEREDRALYHDSATDDTLIETPSGQISYTGYTTTIGDCFPHIIAQIPLGATGPSKNRYAVSQINKLTAVCSIERAYRTLWLQSLWEGYCYNFESRHHSPFTENAERQWSAWEARYHSNLRGNDFRAPNDAIIGSLSLERFPKIDIKPNGRLNVTTVKIPAKSPYDATLAYLQSSEYSTYLQTSIGSDATLGDYVSCFFVLREFASQYLQRVMLPAVRRAEGFKDINSNRFVYCQTLEQWRAMLCSTTGLSADVVEQVIKKGTLDISDLNDVFRYGCWSRFFLPVEGKLALLNFFPSNCDPDLFVQSSIRHLKLLKKVERNVGKAFEKKARESLKLAVQENDVLPEAIVYRRGLIDEQIDEEIDVLFRIGSTLFVGECKCFVVPYEPTERFDYLRKIRTAFAQLERKRIALERLVNGGHQSDLGDVTVTSVQGLLILNTGFGFGLSLGQSTAVDLEFLINLLERSQMLTGGISVGGEVRALSTRTFYNDEGELGESLRAIITEFDGLKNLFNATKLRSYKLPIIYGGDMTSTSSHIATEELLEGVSEKVPQSLLSLLNAD